MSNHHRGLWGYWGETADGAALTVQATGIGGPSAVTVLGELAELGVRRAIRVGTCAVPGSTPALGTGLVVTEACGRDGTSLALGVSPGSEVEPDEDLTAALLAAGGTPTAVVSRDLQLGETSSDDLAVDPRPADLQTAAVLAWCARYGVAAAAVVVVAGAAGRRLEDDPLEAALVRMAGSAATVLIRTA